ncbi:hypothetical protein [Bartonella harrusi]|uniref:Phage related protein n=1 Tax=Bartonella harrusi TaxID=2961895 RepID=A0ABY5ESF5_9HYPH|nr:hypothetical protein [Bartonella harrusi]UTO28059.1 hypothetical protein NMK50_07585 [Bartonella harrusi]
MKDEKKNCVLSSMIGSEIYETQQFVLTSWNEAVIGSFCSCLACNKTIDKNILYQQGYVIKHVYDAQCFVNGINLGA